MIYFGFFFFFVLWIVRLY